ncbi:MAG TPA: PRC and DUF2382 domain-containing protein [Chthoniobacterales bacterium]
MKLLSTITPAATHDLFDYAVVDQSHENIGTLHSMWNNEHTGALEFLGVKTGWLFGSNHVVPADKAQVDESARTIQVPYPLTLIKEAPTIDADAEISGDREAEIHRYYGGSSTAPTAARTTTEGAVREANTGDHVEVPLSEEQVKVGKRTVDAGSVRLRKVVRQETVTQPVEVRREDVVVERVAADQVHAGSASSGFKEEVIDVPLTREEAVVSKEAHVTGAVRVQKTADVDTQNVSETVRKEDVEVVRDGKTEVKRDSDRTRR